MLWYVAQLSTLRCFSHLTSSPFGQIAWCKCMSILVPVSLTDGSTFVPVRLMMEIVLYGEELADLSVGIDVS